MRYQATLLSCKVMSAQSIRRAAVCMKKVYGLILAKSNSIGLPNKNMLLLGKQTLLEIGISQMRDSGVIDEIFVSSDASEILDEAEKCGATRIQRALELTKNEAYADAVKHAVNAMPQDFDLVVLSQIVQPAKSPDLFHRVKEAFSEDTDSVVTVSPFESSPSWLYRGDDKTGRLERIETINYEGTIGRRSDLFEIDNKVVAFSKESFSRWSSMTPWPYLGDNIVYLTDRVVNANLKIDLNTKEDLAWLEIIRKTGVWHV